MPILIARIKRRSPRLKIKGIARLITKSFGQTAMLSIGSSLLISVAITMEDSNYNLLLCVFLIIFMLAIPFMAFSYSYFALATFIRIYATIKYWPVGAKHILHNWHTIGLSLDLITPPELLPEISRKSELKQFSSSRFIEKFKESNRVQKILVFIVGFVMLTPSYFYRLSLKSTFWFYWPLLLASKTGIDNRSDKSVFEINSWPNINAKIWSIASTIVLLNMFLLHLNIVPTGAPGVWQLPNGLGNLFFKSLVLQTITALLAILIVVCASRFLVFLKNNDGTIGDRNYFNALLFFKHLALWAGLTVNGLYVVASEMTWAPQSFVDFSSWLDSVIFIHFNLTDDVSQM